MRRRNQKPFSLSTRKMIVWFCVFLLGFITLRNSDSQQLRQNQYNASRDIKEIMRNFRKTMHVNFTLKPATKTKTRTESDYSIVSSNHQVVVGAYRQNVSRGTSMNENENSEVKFSTHWTKQRRLTRRRESLNFIYWIVIFLSIAVCFWCLIGIICICVKRREDAQNVKYFRVLQTNNYLDDAINYNDVEKQMYP